MKPPDAIAGFKPPHDSVAVPIASSNVRPRTTTLTSATSGGYRMPRRNAISRSKNAGVILPARELDAVVLGIQRLHDRLARALAAAGTARHLRQQLERALAGAEVGQRRARRRPRSRRPA